MTLRARLSRSGRVAVEEPHGWRVVGSVEEAERGWLALTADGRRVYGPAGPVFGSRDLAAKMVVRARRTWPSPT